MDDMNDNFQCKLLKKFCIIENDDKNIAKTFSWKMSYKKEKIEQMKNSSDKKLNNCKKNSKEMVDDNVEGDITPKKIK